MVDRLPYAGTPSIYLVYGYAVILGVLIGYGAGGKYVPAIWYEVQKSQGKKCG